MPAPYVKEFTFPNGVTVTSVVLDQQDFDSFVDELANIKLFGTDQTPSKAQLDAIKEAQQLPLMARGSKTEVFFERWGVKTKHLSVIVRGAGRRMVNDMLNERARRN